jgi:squalene cyclase
VEFNYFNDRVPYQGSLDDGRWWDTILVSWGLLEAGADPSKLVPVIDSMIKQGVQPNGGIAYGYDFEYAPDADDTGLLLLVLSKFGDRYKDQIEKSKKWIATMQNPDGGFPAFDTNKMENQEIYKFAMNLVGISNSAEIFDPSSPDVTTHIMEGYAAIGEGLNNRVIQRSI